MDLGHKHVLNDLQVTSTISGVRQCPGGATFFHCVLLPITHLTRLYLLYNSWLNKLFSSPLGTKIHSFFSFCVFEHHFSKNIFVIAPQPTGNFIHSKSEHSSISENFTKYILLDSH